MEPGWDGDVEFHEGGYWSVGLCAGVGVTGGVVGGVGVDVDGIDSRVVVGVLVVLLAIVVATVVV